MPAVSKSLKIVAAGGVAAVAAGIGAGAAMADSTPTPSGTATSSAPSTAAPGRGGPGGPGGHRGGLGGLDAAALAKGLGVTEARVQAALDAIKADRAASRRTDLSARLDAAVKAGTLSSADRASVLKAFDAGVLGGGRP